MRLFLTGASGELGTPLCRALDAAGHELIVLSRRESAPPGALGRWVRGDLRDPESLRAALECEPEAVVHMAALTHTRKAAEYAAVNVGGTANLLACLQHRPELRFIALSTRALGEAGGAYSASKARAEELVRQSALNWTVLRPAEIYGSGGRDPILALADMLRARRVVPVIGSGRYALAPVHVEDVVAALCATLEPARLELVSRRCYVLAGPEEISFVELLTRIQAILGLPHRRRLHVPAAVAQLSMRVLASCGLGGVVPDQVPRLLLEKSADNTAARRDLGFAPRALEQGLREALEARLSRRE